MASQTDIPEKEIQGQLRRGQFYGHIAGRVELSGITLSDLTHAKKRDLPAHSHEAAFVSMLLHGNYSEHIGSKNITHRAFTTVFHPPEITHKDEIGDYGVRLFMIEIQPAWLGKLQRDLPPLDLSPGVCRGEAMWLATRLYLDYDRHNPLHIEGLTCEMLAAITHAKTVRETRKPRWLAAVIEILRAELHRPLTLEEIATEIGVHPVYLSRVFRATYRQTLGEYLNHLRAQVARQRLAFSDQRLTEIADLCGFADQSHFTRTFRQITGYTPGRFRASINTRLQSSRPSQD